MSFTFKKLIASFDILHQFETSNYNDCESGDTDTQPESSWVTEGLSWLDTAEKVYCHSIDFDTSIVDSTLSFSVWSKGCLQDIQDASAYRRNEDGNPILYLCDSTRDRKNILLHIFQPLTKDIFVFKTCHNIFEKMGIQQDYDTLLQYYGEWFMSLPKATLEKECLGIWCPTVRWLYDIVQQFIDIMVNKQNKDMDMDMILLDALHKFCVEATDLPRAFLLATVCHDAIKVATKQLEDKTYGVLTSDDCSKYSTLASSVFCA